MAYHAVFIYATHHGRTRKVLAGKAHTHGRMVSVGTSFWIIGKKVIEILVQEDNTATYREITEHHITVRQRVTSA